jgi:hypothetical protein
MSFVSENIRRLLSRLALVPLLIGCQSIPTANDSLSPESSLLAVNVLFPSPLRRDHSLVQAFFVRGPIDAGSGELPELIPASFVKRDRAYLLDPAPGSYSLVAVASDVAPSWNREPVAGGVTRTVSSAQIEDLVVFPTELIHRTRAAIRSGDVTFMGALQVRRGERINANAVLQDDLQERIAEYFRPGVTSKSGVSGWFSATWMVDLEATSLSNTSADRTSFFAAALTDLGDSPWAQVVARVAPHDVTAAAARKKPRYANDGYRNPVRVTSKPLVVVPDPKTASPEPIESAPQPKAASPERVGSIPEPRTEALEPNDSPPEPEPQIIAGIPPDSPLARIELGMHHAKVSRILGEPDERIDRLTKKAWIPFYDGPGARLIEWVYAGVGRVVFAVNTGTLLVYDAVYDPGESK